MVKHADLSCLPAAGCRFDPGCRPPAPGSRLPASRGPVKTLSGPARRWREARTAGKVLRNQHFGRNFAYIQNSCPEAPSRRQREARTAGKVLRNQHRGRNFAYIQNSCPEAPARRCRQALTAGRLSEINTGAGISPILKLVPGGSGPALLASPDGGKVVRNQHRGPKFASIQNSSAGAPARR